MALRARYWAAVWCVMLAGSASGHAPRGDAQSELIEAVRAGNGQKVAELLAAGAEPTREFGSIGSPLELAMRYGDAAVLRAFAAHGADLTEGTPGLRGWTPLEYLLLREDVSVEAVKVLIESGAKVKDTKWMFVPPTMTSGALRNGAVMRALLEAGADRDARSEDGEWSALETAVVYGEVGAVRALLDAGAKAEGNRERGRTVWHALAVRVREEGAAELAGLLKGAGAGDVDASGADGWTALQLSAYVQSGANIRALAVAGASVNRRGPGGWTPLMYAAALGDSATVEALIELKADVNAEDEWGRTALSHALRGGDPTSILQHDSREAPAHRRKSAQLSETSVWERVERAGTVEKVRALLGAGADANKAGDPTWTPLALAAYCWDMKTIGGAADGERGDNPSEGSLGAVGHRFYATHDPTVLVRMLVEAGAVRQNGNGEPDALDVAACRTDARRESVMAEVRKAKVVEGKKAGF